MALLMPRPLLDPRELAFLVAARRAILATTDPKGTPRLVPVCFIVDAIDGVRVITHLDDKPKATDDKRALARVRDIRVRPDVTLLVERWDEDWAKLGWLRLTGRAVLMEPGDVPSDRKVPSRILPAAVGVQAAAVTEPMRSAAATALDDPATSS